MRNGKGAVVPDWCETAWQPDMEHMPWAQNTLPEVEFISKTLGLSGHERILDLACGMGRHAIEFARRGHPVVAVDLSPRLIERAREVAQSEGVGVEFICADLKGLSFREEFDVVLNLWEGAIGYQSTDDDNFEVVLRIGGALKQGGQHLAGPLISADFARKHFPVRLWEKGSRMITLSELQWAEASSTIHDTCWRLNLTSDGTWRMDAQPYVGCYRLYSPAEITDILGRAGLSVVRLYNHPELEQDVSDDHMEYWVHSAKGRALRPD